MFIRVGLNDIWETRTLTEMRQCRVLLSKYRLTSSRLQYCSLLCCVVVDGDIEYGLVDVSVGIVYVCSLVCFSQIWNSSNTLRIVLFY
jgi:hypothetical protein